VLPSLTLEHYWWRPLHATKAPKPTSKGECTPTAAACLRHVRTPAKKWGSMKNPCIHNYGKCSGQVPGRECSIQRVYQ